MNSDNHQTAPINPKTVPFQPGTFIGVKGPLRCGKTKTAVAYCNMALQDPDNIVLYIVPDTGLSHSIQDRTGLNHYQQLTAVTAGQARCVVTTIHSLNKSHVAGVYRYPDGSLKPIKLMVLDKVTHILTAITQGFGMDGEAEAIWRTLRELIEHTLQSQGTVFAPDGDWSTRTLDYFLGWYPHWLNDGKLDIYDMPFQDEGKTAYVGTGIKGKNIALARATEVTMNGGVVAIGYDNAKVSTDYDQMIRNLIPNCKVKAINANNNQQPDQKASFSNADQEAKNYQVFVYSRSVVAGLSVTSVKVDLVVILNHNVISPLKSIQLACRFRKAKEFLVIGDICSPFRGCESTEKSLQALERLNNFDNPQPLACNDFDHFVEEETTAENVLLGLGANALWYLLEEREFTVRRLNESPYLVAESEAQQVGELLKAARQEREAQRPTELLEATPLSDGGYQALKSKPNKSEQEQLSCERFRLCQSMGVDPGQLTEEDCTFWLQTGLSVLKRFSAAMGFDIQPDPASMPLCHRRFEGMLQKYLHYLLEPLWQDDYIFLNDWGHQEATGVVERILAMGTKDQWALQRLGLIPDSMIQGQDRQQVIVQPGNPTKFVNDFLLGKRLGLKFQGFQVRHGQKPSWRYRLDPDHLDRMMHYAQQRAREKCMEQLSRVSGKPYIPAVVAPLPESFSNWYQRRWVRKAVSSVVG